MKTLPSFISSYQASDRKCEKIFCSTCGGVAAALKNSIIASDRLELEKFICSLDYVEFAELGDWVEAFRLISPLTVKEHLQNELRNVNPVSTQDFDIFLYSGKHIFKNEPRYFELLNKALDLAIETHNISLIETLVLVLGKDILTKSKFLSIAIDTMNSNRNIHRALYNTIREEVPEVRGYQGTEDPINT